MRQHYRCPICGKLSQPASFGIDGGQFVEGAAPYHELEIATQHFIGRPGGFHWEREEAPEEIIEALRLAARAAYVRLSDLLGMDPDDMNDG